MAYTVTLKAVSRSPYLARHCGWSSQSLPNGYKRN